MATKQVTIANIGQVTLYKRRTSRSLRLSIGPAGDVRVSLPYWLPYKAGVVFANSKIDWITANRKNVDTELRHGCRIGKAHQLSFEIKPSAMSVQTRIKNNQIAVSLPNGITPGHQEAQSAAHKSCIRALRKEAEALLPQRLATISANIGLDYKDVQIKLLKSRWGSCSSNKDITLNLFLMQLPWHLIDYVLVHELVHTKLMQHGAPFWQEVEKHLSNVKQLRREMKEHKPNLAPGQFVA